MVNIRNSKVEKGIIQPPDIATSGGGGGSFGLGVIGPSMPVHLTDGSDNTDYWPPSFTDRIYFETDETMDPVPFTRRFKWCRVEVIDWPFAVDDAGFAFDQANLYGVRMQCWAEGNWDHDIGSYISGLNGEVSNQWVAVPKTLPPGYTMQTRHNFLIWSQNYDSIDTSYNNESGGWTEEGANHYHRGWICRNIHKRTADGADIFDSDPIKRTWVPMNIGTGIYMVIGPSPVSGDPRLSSTSDEEAIIQDYGVGSSDPSESGYGLAGIVNGHIGFRAGKLVISMDNRDGFQSTAYVKIKVCENGASSGLTTIESFTETHTGTGSGTETRTLNIGAMLAPTLGKRADFFVSSKLNLQDEEPGTPDPSDPPTFTDYPGGVGYLYFQGAPRTDVPLAFFTSDGNTCAPGGIVE
jgi:hypothetical protein